MFLSTLGLKSDEVITEMVHAQRQSYDGAIAPVEDRKSSHPRLNKCDAEVICLHLNSDNPPISHYKHKNVPYKWDLNSELSIKEMYKNVSENKENNKIWYKIYCNVFKSSVKDECEICLSYKDHINDFAYTKHKVRCTQDRIEYKKTVPKEVVCFTTDMQRVIKLPKLTTKEHLFVRCLVTFNERFASKTPGKPDYCILWHEAIAGRKAHDVVSAFLH